MPELAPREAMGKTKTIAKAKLHRLYTLEEARSIKGPFVYGLSDGHGIFYVGKTIDARGRFYRYARNSAPKLQKRLAEAGDDVRLSILEHNPKNLDRAERHFIAMYAPDLVNRQGSLRIALALCILLGNGNQLVFAQGISMRNDLACSQQEQRANPKPKIEVTPPIGVCDRTPAGPPRHDNFPLWIFGIGLGFVGGFKLANWMNRNQAKRLKAISAGQSS